jgi:hypothetical protein
MLLFFGSSLKANSHSLADVFEAGIAALTGGNGTHPATACPAPGILGETPPAPTIPQTPAVERPENAAPVDAQLSAGSPALTKVPAAPAENTALRQDADEPVARTKCTTAGCSAPATQAVSSAPLFTLNEHDPWYALDSVPEDDDIYDDEPAVPVALPAFLMAAAEASGHASGASAQQVGGETLIEEKPLPVPPAAQQDDPQAPVEHYTPAPCTVPRGTQEGKSSLCTRSMARVLEEQGATSEAADIYRELLASCSSDEERDELNAKLDSLLQGADPAASAAAISAGQPSPGVLDMLEELAVRLETRSRA